MSFWISARGTTKLNHLGTEILIWKVDLHTYFLFFHWTYLKCYNSRFIMVQCAKYIMGICIEIAWNFFKENYVKTALLCVCRNNYFSTLKFWQGKLICEWKNIQSKFSSQHYTAEEWKTVSSSFCISCRKSTFSIVNNKYLEYKKI